MRADDLFYIMKDGKITGPFSSAELIEGIAAGKLSPRLEVCPMETNHWGLLAEYFPGPVAAAAAKLIVKQKKARQWTQTGAVIAGCLIIAALLWGWFAHMEERKAKDLLTAAGYTGQEKEAEIAQAKNKLQEASETASQARERARKLELQILEVESLANQAKRSEEESQKRLQGKEAELVKKARELSDKSAELESKKERIKTVEAVAIKYADRLVQTVTQIQEIGRIPKSVCVVVDVTGESVLPFNVSGIRSAAEGEFRAAGYRIAKSAEESGNALVCQIWIVVGEARFAGFRCFYFSANSACMARSYRSGLHGWATLFNADTLGFAREGDAYQSQLIDAITSQVRDLRRDIEGVQNRVEGEVVSNPPQKLYADLIAVGLKGKAKEEIAPRNRKMGGSGSGVVMASRPLILTNSHVVDEAKRVVAYLGPDQKAMEAVVLFQDKNRDLAVLTLKERTKMFEEMPMPVIASEDQVKLGVDVYSLGFPLVDIMGTEVKYSSGAVSALSGLQGAKGRLQVSVPTQPGNSGGPVFLKEGIMCGVMVSTVNPFSVVRAADALPQNVNYAVDAGSVRSFLLEHGLWDELEADTREPLDIEAAKNLTVRIEVE